MNRPPSDNLVPSPGGVLSPDPEVGGGGAPQNPEKPRPAPGREEAIPPQTGGSGVYRVTPGNRTLALACDLDKSSDLLLPSLSYRIPYIKHPGSGHVGWVLCECLNV